MYTEVAERLTLHPENTKLLLDALTGVELLEKDKGLYINTQLSNKYLSRSSEWFIGGHLRVYNSGAGFMVLI